MGYSKSELPLVAVQGGRMSDLGITQVEFEMPCPGCGRRVACVAVLDSKETHTCPHCRRDFDVTVSKARKAGA